MTRIVLGFYESLIVVGPVLLIALYGLAVSLRKLPSPRRLRGWSIAVLASALAVTWPFMQGVWPPDIFTFGSPHTLARATGASGASYEVVQYWNYVDFYTTELRITSASAGTRVIELDGDDQKSWSVPLSVDEAAGAATVTLSGKRTIKVNLRDGTRSASAETKA
jgi:hypothetical protein